MDIKDIRNIGIIAHIDAGKTTTTERILYYTHKTHRMGEVDEGTTVTDYLKEEKERGITITSACVSCNWRDKRISILDTPGHVDFTVEVERSLRILDGAVVIFSAVEGVESQSETVWYQANKYNVPRIVYINKLDRLGADPYEACNMMREKLAATPLLIQTPYGIENSFQGVVDLIRWKLCVWEGDGYTLKDIPPEVKKRARAERENLLETVSLYNDHIAELFLDGIEPSPQELISAIREGTIANHYYPTLFGTSLKNIGVQSLLDGIVDFLPSPIDLPPIKGKTLDGKETERRLLPGEPMSALIFKIVQDPFGKLSYTRVYSGRIKKGSVVLDANAETKERISRIFLMYANKREEIEEATAGDICGIFGPKGTKTGHTLCAKEYPLLLESPTFAQPVISVSIEPKTKADEGKLLSVLRMLEEEDPTFICTSNEETGETIISGMGELHLEVLTKRITRDYGLEARVSKPRVSYRETICRDAKEEGKYVRQTGGRGHYGHVKLAVSPLENGKGVSIDNSIRQGEVPREFFPAIKEGILESLDAGVFLGFPVVDIRVDVTGGSYHEVDSSSIDYKIAASIAVKRAIEKAEPCLLEPIMELEIILPGEYLGAVLDDINARNGKVTQLHGKRNIQTVMAICPLRNLFGYATAIRSLTQGRAVYIMEFGHYGKVPQGAAEEMMKKIRGY
ncbi:elongation factor G [candidate division WOR-3 bacterium JGI_Cruoil_03_44_89]|uniref:Elongation factor G n=1 Tax=candidate division WOR-3 bacterium JGI_Cruoil_03_44_89 TaxID=1973748 RepID=A0A235BSM4_UNCW3|nr:MAG: elongation factor G [candidate division WOR-3 bacterium JGI_Cruoil_03_44_89]